MQDKLVTEQIAEEGHQEVTDNGVTIRAVQTIQDSRCFYALFEVIVEDGNILLNEENNMEFSMNFKGKENPFGYFGSGFVADAEQEVTSRRYYELFGNRTEESGEELDMEIHFTGIQGTAEKGMAGPGILSGKWDFSLSLHPADTVVYEPDREYRIGGCPVTVRRVELSPLSVKMVFDGAGVRALEEKEGISLDGLDTLSSLYINAVRYQDGALVEEDGWNGMEEGFDGEGNYVRSARFSAVIDPDQAAALLLGDQMDEILLQNKWTCARGGRRPSPVCLSERGKFRSLRSEKNIREEINKYNFCEVI